MANVSVVGTIDPIMDLGPRVTTVHKGPAIRMFQQVPAPSSASPLTWSITPPGGVVINRRLMVAYNISVTLTGTTIGGALLCGPSANVVAPYWCFRAFPMSQCIQQASMTINSLNVSNDQTHVSAIVRTMSREERRIHASCCPSMPDSFQDNSDATLLGLNASPAANMSDRSETQRGLFPMTVSNHTTTSCTFTSTIIEPIFLPTLLQTSVDQPGFANVSLFNINLILGDLTRAFWMAPAASKSTITAISAKLNSAPTLILEYLTPPSDFPIPPTVSYPYKSIYAGPTQLVTAAGTAGMAPYTGADVTRYVNQGVQVNCPVFQANSTPDYALVFVRQSNTSGVYPQTAGGLDASSADVFAPITKISLQWGSTTNILSDASQWDLWNISAENGVDISYPSAVSYTGYPLLLKFGKDIPLLEGDFPGRTSPSQFAIQVWFVNPRSSSGFNQSLAPLQPNAGTGLCQYTLFVYLVLSGRMDLNSDGSGALLTSYLDSSVYKSAEYKPRVSQAHIRMVTGGGLRAGGNVFSDIWNGLTTGYRYAKKALPIADTLTSLIPGAGAVNGAIKAVRAATGEGLKKKKRGRKAGSLFGVLPASEVTNGRGRMSIKDSTRVFERPMTRAFVRGVEISEGRR